MMIEAYEAIRIEDWRNWCHLKGIIKSAELVQSKTHKEIQNRDGIYQRQDC